MHLLLLSIWLRWSAPVYVTLPNVWSAVTKNIDVCESFHVLLIIHYLLQVWSLLEYRVFPLAKCYKLLINPSFYKGREPTWIVCTFLFFPSFVWILFWILGGFAKGRCLMHFRTWAKKAAKVEWMNSSLIPSFCPATTGSCREQMTWHHQHTGAQRAGALLTAWPPCCQGGGDRPEPAAS